MLENQTFTKNILIGVGSTLFSEPTAPNGLDLPLVSVFKSALNDVVGYDFVFVDEVNAQPDLPRFVSLIEGLGVSFKGVYLFDKKNVSHLAQFNGLLGTLDLLYSPSMTLQTPGVIHMSKVVHLHPIGFLECLLTLSGLPNPFSVELFRQIENQWTEQQITKKRLDEDNARSRAEIHSSPTKG